MDAPGARTHTHTTHTSAVHSQSEDLLDVSCNRKGEEKNDQLELGRKEGGKREQGGDEAAI